MKNSPAGTVRSPSGPWIDELRVESDQHGREVGGRIAVRDRAADRAAVAHLRIADQPRRVRENRAVLLEQRVVLEVVVPGERPDRELSPASRT